MLPTLGHSDGGSIALIHALAHPVAGAHVEAVRDLAAGPVELLVLDCAHAPHLEHPARTEAAVTAFLSSLR